MLLLRPTVFLSIHLDKEEKTLWQSHLLQWKTNSHHAINWVAMRALAAFQRGRLLNRDEDIHDAEAWLNEVLATQTKDGCFDDLKGLSRPSQYHAYTACLLLPLKALDKKRIMKACVLAARWLLTICAPDADINTLGRGQGQIFGYACAIYLFRNARTFDAKNASAYCWAEKKILAQLSEALSPEGFLPLVINDAPVETRAGWYDYHHLTVYNSFCLVWLSLARDVTPDESCTAALAPAGHQTRLKDSGLYCARSNGFSFLFAAGESGAGYAADAGITPHYLFFRDKPLFKYPCGPGPGKYGRRWQDQGQEQNIWAPLVKKQDHWIGPFGGSGRIVSSHNNTLTLEYTTQGILWKRKIFFSKNVLEIRDSIDLAHVKFIPQKLRIVNIALKKRRVAEQYHSGLYLLDNDILLGVWGDVGRFSKKRHVTASDGEVEIYALEVSNPEKKVYKGGVKLRSIPGHSANNMPAIVCMSWDPWTDIWKRKQRLAFEMSEHAKGSTVLYIEPPVSSTTITEDLRQLTKPGQTGDRYRRAVSGALISKGKKFFLYTPLQMLPGSRSFPQIKKTNRWIQERFMRRKIRKLKLKSYILWLYHPSQLWAIDIMGCKAELIIFDWTDDWVASFPDHLPEKERACLEKNQEVILQRADIVFAVSEALCKRAKEYCPNVFHLPNATDPDVFKPAAVGSPKHRIFGESRGPNLVYLSQITDRLDVELLEAVACERPDWQMFLIGPEVCSQTFLTPLKRQSNIHFCGSLTYQDAAMAVSQADVCILPHKEDELTRTLDPIKLYDYLATGRPVVSSNVAMNDALKPYIKIASTPESFIREIEVVLAESVDAEKIRRNEAMNHIWKKRSDEAMQIMAKFF